MATSKPDMSNIWADAGAAVQPSTGKINEGWVAEKPPFQTENWVQQRQDQYLKHLDEHGLPEWANNSEYVIGSRVWYLNKNWTSLQDPNLGNTPIDGGGFWTSDSPLDSRGGTATGPILFNQGVVINGAAADTEDYRSIKFVQDSFLRARVVFSDATDDYRINIHDNAGAFVRALIIPQVGAMTLDGFQVWTQGNDGAGSGLDADTLDGQHASDIISASAFVANIIIHGSTPVTVPAGANKVIVKAVGGGGGGGGGGDGGNGSGANGGTGGSTTVIRNSVALGDIIITAPGGGGGTNNVTGGAAAAAATVSINAVLVGHNGNNSSAGGNGAAGNPAPGGHGGGGVWSVGGYGSTSSSNVDGQRGGGGGAGGWGQDSLPGGGGGSGAAIVYSFDVVPGDVINCLPAGGGVGGGPFAVQGTGGEGGIGSVELTFTT